MPIIKNGQSAGGNKVGHTSYQAWAATWGNNVDDVVKGTFNQRAGFSCWGGYVPLMLNYIPKHQSRDGVGTVNWAQLTMNITASGVGTVNMESIYIRQGYVGTVNWEPTHLWKEEVGTVNWEPFNLWEGCVVTLNGNPYTSERVEWEPIYLNWLGYGSLLKIRLNSFP